MGYPIVGEKWWVRAASYLSGDLRLQLILNDEIQCCCPEETKSISGVIDIHLRIEYWEIAERWQVLQKVGETLFFPLWIKAALFGNNAINLSEMIPGALPEGLTDLSASAICESHAGSMTFSSSMSATVTHGNPPSSKTNKWDKSNFSVDIGDNLGDMRWCPDLGLELYNPDMIDKPFEPSVPTGPKF